MTSPSLVQTTQQHIAPAKPASEMTEAQRVRRVFAAENWLPTVEARNILAQTRGRMQRDVMVKTLELSDDDLHALWVIVGRLTYQPEHTGEARKTHAHTHSNLGHRGAGNGGLQRRNNGRAGSVANG